MSPGALPVLGALLANTVLPLLGRLQLPLAKWQMFSPAAVPARFRRDYSDGMAVRPAQLRATSQDGALMIPSVLALRAEYGRLELPVTIIAGDGDKVVFMRNSKRLAAAIRGSVLQIVPGAGHMVHHLVPRRVARAVDEIAAQQQPPGEAGSPGGMRRQ